MTPEDIAAWEHVARRGWHLALLFGDAWLNKSSWWLTHGALFHSIDRGHI